MVGVVGSALGIVNEGRLTLYGLVLSAGIQTSPSFWPVSEGLLRLKGSLVFDSFFSSLILMGIGLIACNVVGQVRRLWSWPIDWVSREIYVLLGLVLLLDSAILLFDYL